MKENKMKSKRHHKHPGPDWQGKKTAVSQDKQKSLVSSSSQVRPFAGKVFYLDLQSNRTAETLESDIKELGGTVEKFFSKEIRYLVSNKREAKYVHCLRQDSPVPSPDSGQSSPHPHCKLQRPVNHVDKVSNRSQDQADSLVKSRGKSLVEKVIKGQERVQLDRILSNALEWGVKILYVDDVLAYVQKKKQHTNIQVSSTAAVKKSVKTESSSKRDLQKLKGNRICNPFVKVEDSSRHYRPIYLTMPNMPEFNLKTAAPCSPFCLEDKDQSKQQGHRGTKGSGSEEKAQGRKKNRDKKRGGYCECCMMKYFNLKTHLQSERHRAFSKSDEYAAVDRLVSTLHFSFVPIKTKVGRTKCSVSSVLFVPGPCEQTIVSHQEDPDRSEAAKVKERRSVDEAEGSYSRQSLNSGSSPVSAAQIQSKGDRWNCYTYSETAKHRSSLCERTSGQKPLSFCSQKSEWIQTPELKSETLPSRGSFPSKDTPVKLVDQIPHKDTESVNVVTQSDDTNKDEALRVPNTFSETENNLSEKEETSLYTPNLSSVRNIQRRVRVYEHKRRKVDVNVEHAEPSDTAGSLQKLWELFQSSDDMEMEFHGFTD